MRVSQAEMDKSHARIVEGATRLFREKGLENTSVADVMSDAGLTHGGFYRHFENKDALVAAALQTAFDDISSNLESRTGKTDPHAACDEFHNQYLSKRHLENAGKGCPIPTLAGDVARGSTALRIAFGAGVKRLVTALARGKSGSDEQKRATAARELALIAGAMLIARASDPETARMILAACRDHDPAV